MVCAGQLWRGVASLLHDGLIMQSSSVGVIYRKKRQGVFNSSKTLDLRADLNYMNYDQQVNLVREA